MAAGLPAAAVPSLGIVMTVGSGALTPVGRGSGSSGCHAFGMLMMCFVGAEAVDVSVKGGPLSITS